MCKSCGSSLSICSHLDFPFCLFDTTFGIIILLRLRPAITINHINVSAVAIVSNAVLRGDLAQGRLVVQIEVETI